MSEKEIYYKLVEKMEEALSLSTMVALTVIIISKLIFYLHMKDILSEREIDEICL